MRPGITAAIAATAMISAVSLAEAGDGWSGYYVGLETGVAYNIVTLTGPFGPTGVETQQDLGALAGVFAGADGQFGKWVFGGLVDFDYIGTDPLVFAGKLGSGYDMNWVATARVRAGFAPNDKVLLFGTAGLALAGADATFLPLVLDSRQIGYVVGAGAEYRFARNWSVKGEFLHHNFGNRLKDITPDYTMTPVLNSFKVGLAYRF